MISRIEQQNLSSKNLEEGLNFLNYVLNHENAIFSDYFECALVKLWTAMACAQSIDSLING